MGAGEGKRLSWIKIDFEKHIITLNDPEKGSNPCMWEESQKLVKTGFEYVCESDEVKTFRKRK